MTFKKIALAAVAIGAIGMAAPASAGDHHCGSSGYHGSSTSGWSSSGGHHGSSSGWSGSSSGGHTGSSSGGHHGSSSGTQVPEPGMLGIFGAGLLAVGVARTRRRRKA